MGVLRLLIVLVVATFGAPSPKAWLREQYEDAIVAERSEAIAEGAIKPDSIRRVELPDSSHEHHATLSVSRVHKGKIEAKEIPVVIHYGLSPRTTPAGTVELWDSGNSAVSPEPILKDIARDTLWFLRKGAGNRGKEPSKSNLWIEDPEDVKSASLRDYILAYLASDPEKAVRAAVKDHPELEERARSYFVHQDVVRIVALQDVAVKCQKLIAYFLQRHYWNGREEAADALVRLGDPAGLALRGVFENPEHKEFREDVIRVWGEMKSCPAVKLLTMTLRGQKGYWDDQKLEKGWWSSHPQSELTRERHENYSVLFQSIIALGKIGDPKAREALELIRTQWADPRFGFDQIFKECESALDQLGK